MGRNRSREEVVYEKEIRRWRRYRKWMRREEDKRDVSNIKMKGCKESELDTS